MRKKITAAQATVAGLVFMFAVLVAGPHALAQDLVWNTFLGAASNDFPESMTIDESGNVYVTGYCGATWGSPVRAHAGGSDAFAAKFDASGALVWNTFLGSAGSDFGLGIAVDGSGNVYVTGYSTATWGSPVAAYAGTDDAFAAKLDSSGALVWNTFLGSANFDKGLDIAIDGSGNVYVAGESDATWGSPVAAHAGGNDAFAAQLDDGGALVWNTFLGSANADYCSRIALDDETNVYVAGESDATWGSPVAAHAGGNDAFAAQLDDGGALVWNTFLGSGSGDYGNGIALDEAGNVYVAGESDATWGSPVAAHAGGFDAFAAQLDDGGALVWNTFLGSANHDFGSGIAVDEAGHVYVGGYSYADWGSPVNAYAGGDEVFAAQLDDNGTLVWSTFLGSANSDYFSGIAVEGSGNVRVAGRSLATWGSPVHAHAGGFDGFVAKLFQPCETSADCPDDQYCDTDSGQCMVVVKGVLDTGDPAEQECNPKSYTDLGNGIVLDNVTGLEWQQATSPGTYTWQEALDYIDELNDNETLGLGYDDWRLPTIEELSTLVDAGRYNSAIDPIFSTVASDYWSSTTYASDTGYAWVVGFYDGYDGYVGYNGKTYYYYVRAVRGGQYGSLDNYVINGDGTVTDKDTDLMWQQCNYGQTWSVTACTGSAATRTWDEAAAYVQELNDNNTLGYDDWRLPTRNELQSIVNYSLYAPATTLPDSVAYSYWSSTTYAGDTNYAWDLNFDLGFVNFSGKATNDYVRAVRGGPCRSEGDWCIDESDCDDGVFCNGTEICVDSLCQPGEDPCGGGLPFCDEELGTCLECLVAGDCVNDDLFCTGPPICEDNVCGFSDDPCLALGKICDEETTSCIDPPACEEDADCADDLYCNGEETCVDEACVGGTSPCAENQTCNEETDTCVDPPPCGADADCADDLYCNGEETCVAGFCAAGTGPCSGNTPACDEDNDRCVECLSSADCAGDLPVCNESANVCVECLVDSDCAEDELCAENMCIPRCEINVSHKQILSEKLTKSRKAVLKITSADKELGMNSQVALAPFTPVKMKYNQKKKLLKIRATVPAGLSPGVYPIRVDGCLGDVVVE